MAFQDQTLACRDCGKSFVWTAGEQEFYQQKGFDNTPSRCPECRKNKKAQRNNGPRELHTITCSKCGKEDTVPFKPRDESSVLCGDCFKQNRAAA